MIACLTSEAVSTPRTAAPVCHDKFMEMVPAIQSYARRSFANLPTQARSDAIDEVIAQAFVAFARLVELGKADLAYSTPLAFYAVKQVRSGRYVGRRNNVRDVMSEQAQRQKGFRVGDFFEYDAQRSAWREILVEDKHSSPAETAISRIDFAAWLNTLSTRQRRIAQVLALNESTAAVAQRFQLSCGRISQIRQELNTAWQQFQGDALALA